jgi:hypothetical protein
MMNRSFLACLLVASTSLVPACASDAQKRAQDGATALSQCDLRTAHQAFSDAFGMDATDPGIALAFALTDIVLLPEDPALQALGPRFGFTKAFDTTFLWSKGGLLDQVSKKTTTCSALGDFVRANIAHPSLAATSPTPFLDVLDQKLTFADLRDAGVAMSPRFDKLSHAFETAAGAAGSGGVDIKGGCGANDIVLQKPELYALAGTFALLEAVFQLLRVYDDAVHLWPLFKEIAGETGAESAFVSDMNAAFLHIADASQAASAKTLFQRSFGLFVQATTAAQAVTQTPANAVIDWTAFPKLILADAQKIAQAAHDAFDAPTPIPFLTPAVTVDGPSFIATPLELAPLTPAAFGLDASNNVTFTFTPMQTKLGARFTPNPMTSGASYKWTFIDDISNATNAQQSWGTATFDPNKRFSSAYACQ